MLCAHCGKYINYKYYLNKYTYKNKYKNTYLQIPVQCLTTSTIIGPNLNNFVGREVVDSPLDGSNFIMWFMNSTTNTRKSN